MYENKRVEFTAEMKQDYTILIPNMLPVHFELLHNIFALHGYKVELLKNEGQAVIDLGLKYVHNDTCYPALLVIGQMLDALLNGQYDPNKVALMITQTGGGCRASNYIHLLRKALARAGFGHIPVISLNTSGLEKNSGFEITLPLLLQAGCALIYGDLMLLLKNQTKPYEIEPGESDRLVERWTDALTEQFRRSGRLIRNFKRNLQAIVADFAAIPLNHTPRPKVGIVGEIYVKYSSMANNHLEQFLIDQGCEVMVPGIMSFIFYIIDNNMEDIRLYGGSLIRKKVFQFAMYIMQRLERMMIRTIKEVGCFKPPSPFAETRLLIDGILERGCKMGEGWLLTAEIMELLENGFENVICVQPFGCLPNHIVGKGTIRTIRELRPKANIVPIDYDPGTSRVNQENRIKLMLAVAQENVDERKGA